MPRYILTYSKLRSFIALDLQRDLVCALSHSFEDLVQTEQL